VAVEPVKFLGVCAGGDLTLRAGHRVPGVSPRLAPGPLGLRRRRTLPGGTGTLLSLSMDSTGHVG
jgi:hypothetical protein